MTTPAVCQVHRRHSPMPLVLHEHHLQPLAMGGPNVPDNRLTVCPTGHYSIHAILAALVFGLPRPGGTRLEKQFAAVGYERWIAAGKPGNSHAAYGTIHDSGESGAVQ